MSKPIIVVGAGCHARVLIDALLAIGETLLGITTPMNHAQADVLGVPILGDDSALERYEKESIFLVNGLGSTHSMKARQDIFERFKAEGYLFATVVHPSAVLGRNVALGEGTQVMAGAVIQTGARLGANCIVNTRASVDHDCLIGDHVHIAPGATLSGSVTVGRASHIGCGSTIIQGVQIAEEVLVGAGSVVLHDIPAGRTVGGVPARNLGERS